jgi:hypothetical protein
VTHDVPVPEDADQLDVRVGWRLWRDPGLWLLPWERPRYPFSWWHDSIRWRLMIAVGLLAGVGFSASELAAGPSPSWVWAVPVFIVSAIFAVWFVLTVVTLPIRPVRGSDRATQALHRGVTRRQTFTERHRSGAV